LDEAIVAERLRLVIVPRSVLEAAAATGHGVHWPGIGAVSDELVATMPCTQWLARLDADPGVARWSARGIVIGDPDSPTGHRLVGHAGGHGRPDAEGRAEAGYTLAADERGKGIATEAVRAWFDWAHRLGARTARVSIADGNAPSSRLAARLGLTPVDRVWDEDDAVWETVLEAPLPLRAAAR